MAKLNKEQLKKLYDYGGTLSPKNWADMIDSVTLDTPDEDSPSADPNNIIQISYKTLIDNIENGLLIPNQWYEFFYYNVKFNGKPGSIRSVRVRAANKYCLYENALCYGIPFIDLYSSEIVSKWFYCKYTIDSIHYAYNREFIKIHIDELNSSYREYISKDLYYRICEDNEFVFISVPYDHESNPIEILIIYQYDGMWYCNDDYYDGIRFDKQTGFVSDIRINNHFFSYDIFDDTAMNEMGGGLVAPNPDIVEREETYCFIGDPISHQINTIRDLDTITEYHSRIINSNILLDYTESVLHIDAINHYGRASIGTYINSKTFLNIPSWDYVPSGTFINCILRGGLSDQYLADLPSLHIENVHLHVDVLLNNASNFNYDLGVITPGIDGPYFAEYPQTNLE